MSTECSNKLPFMTCPLCGKIMVEREYPTDRPIPQSRCYDDCLRRCEGCKGGYSNSRTSPTLICKNPLDNIPSEVWERALSTLEMAVNVRNRENKVRKFGFSTSEDAVTWTVFKFLTEQPDLLSKLGRSLFNLPPAGDVSVLLWGVPVNEGGYGLKVRKSLISLSRTLGEDPRSMSEPDVILDYGDSGIVVIEVKYRSGNDRKTDAHWDRYLTCEGAFTDADISVKSGLYELVRNWRFAHDLAGGRPFVLVNLAPKKTLTNTKGMMEFLASLASSDTNSFMPLSWDNLLSVMEQEYGSLPVWLTDYLRLRGLR